MTLRAGWGAVAFYTMMLVLHYRRVARWLRHEPIDDGVAVISGSVRLAHYLLVLTQNGRVRTYAAGMVLGVVLLLLAWLWR